MDEMKLIPITQQEDKTKELYASEQCQMLLAMCDDFYEKVGYNIPWVGYFIIKQDKIVGSCSFVGEPKDGKVELAYWTFKEFEGQGIASFACKKLVAIAMQADPSLTITAKTAPERNASTKILENNHFAFKEIVQDDEIGDAWLWVHKMV